MYPFITQKNAPALTKEERKKLFENVNALHINKLSSTLVNNTDNMIIIYLKSYNFCRVCFKLYIISKYIRSVGNSNF